MRGFFKDCTFSKEFNEEVNIMLLVKDLDPEGEFHGKIKRKDSDNYTIFTKYCGTSMDSDIIMQVSREFIEKCINDVITALEFFHENDVYHMDIKPANICTDGKVAKLIDWGLSIYGIIPLFGTKYIGRVYNTWYKYWSPELFLLSNVWETVVHGFHVKYYHLTRKLSIRINKKKLKMPKWLVSFNYKTIDCCITVEFDNTLAIVIGEKTITLKQLLYNCFNDHLKYAYPADIINNIIDHVVTLDRMQLISEILPKIDSYSLGITIKQFIKLKKIYNNSIEIAKKTPRASVESSLTHIDYRKRPTIKEFSEFLASENKAVKMVL